MGDFRSGACHPYWATVFVANEKSVLGFEPWRSWLPASQLPRLFEAAGGPEKLAALDFVEVGCGGGESTVPSFYFKGGALFAHP